MKETINDDFDYLDGYDELPDDLQETVRKAFEQGHVDDEDWRGVPYFRIMEENLVTDVLQDVEQNRTGASRSFRSPAAKKKKKAEGEPDVSQSFFPVPPFTAYAEVRLSILTQTHVL